MVKYSQISERTLVSKGLVRAETPLKTPSFGSELFLKKVVRFHPSQPLRTKLKAMVIGYRQLTNQSTNIHLFSSF